MVKEEEKEMENVFGKVTNIPCPCQTSLSKEQVKENVNKACTSLNSSSSFGRFFKIEVEFLEANQTRLTCNCDDFRKHGYCEHSMVFGLVWFTNFPTPEFVKIEESSTWDDHREKIIIEWKKRLIWSTAVMNENSVPKKNPWMY